MAVSAQAIQGNVASGFRSGLADSKQPVTLKLPLHTAACVVGKNAASLAVACLIKAAGHEVSFVSDCEGEKSARLSEELPVEFEVRRRGASVGSLRGEAVERFTSDIGIAIRHSDCVIVAEPATNYGALAKRIAPHLKDNQTVCLVDAPMGASLEFSHRLRAARKQLHTVVVEVGKLFDSVRVERHTLVISGHRERITVSGSNRNETRRGLPAAGLISKSLVPASNMLERGLSEAERIVRPVLLLFALLGGREEELENTTAILNGHVIDLLASIESEINAVAKEFGVVVPDFSKALSDFALKELRFPLPRKRQEAIKSALEALGPALWGQSLLDASQAELASQKKLNSKDGKRSALVGILGIQVFETLGLLAEMGRVAHVSMPVLNSVIELSSALCGADLSKQARCLSDLGLVGFDRSEIVEVVNS